MSGIGTLLFEETIQLTLSARDKFQLLKQNAMNEIAASIISIVIWQDY